MKMEGIQIKQGLNRNSFLIKIQSYSTFIEQWYWD